MHSPVSHALVSCLLTYFQLEIVATIVHVHLMMHDIVRAEAVVLWCQGGLWMRTSWTRYLCPRYVDYNSICSTPICHSFYLGILKDLVVNITETRESLASASARAQVAAFDQPNCAPGSFPAEYALSPVARKQVTARLNSMVIT